MRHENRSGTNCLVHLFIENVHRADLETVRLIVTGLTIVVAARHLVEMATMRTCLGRVRFINFGQVNACSFALGKCVYAFSGCLMSEPKWFHGYRSWFRVL